MLRVVAPAPTRIILPAGEPLTRRRLRSCRRTSRSWCKIIPSEEKAIYPLDQTDGGEDDDPLEHQAWAKQLADMGRNPKAPWKTQYKEVKIHDADYISDDGGEVWSVMEARGIKNVMLVGVHTNMCVLGRPFGLRQMAKNGKNVVLVRDMTDTMYNPLRWPYVSHFQGTDLIVEHIEKFVCPTITSDQLIGGKAFRFKHDRRKKAVIVLGERLYETEKTLPKFAAEVLRDQVGMDVTILKSVRQGSSSNSGPGGIARRRGPGGGQCSTSCFARKRPCRFEVLSGSRQAVAWAADGKSRFRHAG